MAAARAHAAAGASGRADPLLGAVGEPLVLPDRHLGLERVDERPGRVERLAAVGGGGGDHDRDVADREPARRGAPRRRRARRTPRRPARRPRAARPSARRVGGVLQRRRRPGRRRGRGPGRRRASARRRPRRRARRRPRRRRAASPGGRRGAAGSPGLSSRARALRARRRTLAGRSAANDPGRPTDDGVPVEGTPTNRLRRRPERRSGARRSSSSSAAAACPTSAQLFSQMQSMMQPLRRPVNWDARHRHGPQDRRPAARPLARRRSRTTRSPTRVRLADHWLDEATEFPSGVTSTAAWSRAEWIVGTTDVWKVLVEPIAERPSVRAGQRAARRRPRRWPARCSACSARPSARCSATQVGSGARRARRRGAQRLRHRPPARSDRQGRAGAGQRRRRSPRASTSAEDDVLLYLALREAAHQRLFAARAVAARAPDRRGRRLRPRHRDRHRRIQSDRGADARHRPRPTPQSMQELLDGGLFDLPQSPAAAGRPAAARGHPRARRGLGRRGRRPGHRRADADRRASCRRPYAAAGPPVVRPRRPSPRWSGSSCGRAGCATPPPCGARCAPARAPRPATASGCTPTCCPPPPTSTTRSGFREGAEAPEELTDGRLRRRAARPARRRPGRRRRRAADDPARSERCTTTRWPTLRGWAAPDRRPGTRCATRYVAPPRGAPRRADRGPAAPTTSPPARWCSPPTATQVLLDPARARPGAGSSFGGHCEPGDETLAGAPPARGRRGVRASPTSSSTRCRCSSTSTPCRSADPRGGVHHLDVRFVARRPGGRRARGQRGVARRALVAGRRAARPASRRCTRWSRSARARLGPRVAQSSASPSSGGSSSAASGPAEQVALGPLGLRVAVHPGPERARRGRPRAGARARGPARSRPPSRASPCSRRGQPDRAVARRARAPAATSGCRPSAPTAARPGRRGSASLSAGARRSRSSSLGRRRASDRSSRATIVSTHSASSARVSAGRDQHHDPVALAVGRDGAAAPLGAAHLHLGLRRAWRSRSRGHGRTSYAASRLGPGQQPVARPGVDDPVGLDAGGLGPLAAVVEEVELARARGRRCRWRSRQPTSRASSSSVGRRVAALGPGVDLDRDVVLDAGLEDRPRVELAAAAGCRGCPSPAGRCSGRARWCAGCGSRRASAGSSARRPSAAWSARWRPGRRAGPASRRSGRARRRRGCRPRSP